MKKIKVMKKLFTTSIVTCVILAAGCATVKENENAEEKELDKNVVRVEDFGNFTKTTFILPNGDTAYRYEGDYVASMEHSRGKSMDEIWADYNDYCKRQVSVSPNPTSSSATININLGFHSLTYKLIFDEKIIYEDSFLGNKERKRQIAIPDHLLQKDGVYIVAYEIDIGGTAGGGLLRCKNVVQFMVDKNPN